MSPREVSSGAADIGEFGPRSSGSASGVPRSEVVTVATAGAGSGSGTTSATTGFKFFALSLSLSCIGFVFFSSDLAAVTSSAVDCFGFFLGELTSSLVLFDERGLRWDCCDNGRSSFLIVDSSLTGFPPALSRMDDLPAIRRGG